MLPFFYRRTPHELVLALVLALALAPALVLVPALALALVRCCQPTNTFVPPPFF